MMVEEMMILAGEVAAMFAQERNLPIPFRMQRRPKVCLLASAPMKWAFHLEGSDDLAFAMSRVRMPSFSRAPPNKPKKRGWW